jgi:hypothetical protein
MIFPLTEFLFLMTNKEQIQHRNGIANVLNKSCLLIMTTLFLQCSSQPSTNRPDRSDCISLISFLPSYPLIPRPPSLPFLPFFL